MIFWQLKLDGALKGEFRQKSVGWASAIAGGKVQNQVQ